MRISVGNPHMLHISGGKRSPVTPKNAWSEALETAAQTFGRICADGAKEKPRYSGHAGLQAKLSQNLFNDRQTGGHSSDCAHKTLDCACLRPACSCRWAHALCFQEEKDSTSACADVIWASKETWTCSLLQTGEKAGRAVKLWQKKKTTGSSGDPRKTEKKENWKIKLQEQIIKILPSPSWSTQICNPHSILVYDRHHHGQLGKAMKSWSC